MGHADGAHTHGDHGGSGAGVILLIIGAVFAVSVGGAIASALASLLAVLAIATVTILGCAAASIVGLLIWRTRGPHRPVAPPPWQSIQPTQRAEIPKAQRPAIEQPREYHLHLHGVSAEEVAAVLRQEDISDR